jgi:hypothetical protein
MMTLGEISKQETSGCKTTIVTIMEPGWNQSSMFTDQLYIANSIFNYEMEIDHLCPKQR